MKETILEVINKLIHTIELGDKLTTDEKVAVRRVAIAKDNDIKILKEIAWQYDDLLKDNDNGKI